MDSPEDNTALLRMKNEFRSFIGQSSVKNKLSFEQSGFLDETSVAGGSHSSSVTMKSIIEREKEENLRKAELITAKSYICKLEQQVTTLDTSRKRARIEHDKDVENIRKGYEGELQKIEELKTELQFLTNKEEYARNHLAELKQTHDLMKASYEQKVHQLQKDKLQLEVQLEETELSLRAHIKQMKNELMRQETELKICRLEQQENKELLKTQQRRFAECNQQLKELEECRTKAMDAENKIRSLESNLTQIEENSVITNAMKSKLDSFPELEKENRKLKDQNQYLRDTQDNILLLREQAESARIKLERAESKLANLNRLQGENEELKKKLKKWEAEDMTGIMRPQSPSQLTKRLAELQKSEALLLEKQGQLQASIHSMQQALKDADTRANMVAEQNIAEKNKMAQQADFIKRLQRKLLLVTKERDGFKKIIDSYESEVTLNMGSLAANQATSQMSQLSAVANQSSARVNQLEETVQMYSRQNASLENSVAQLTDELLRSKNKIDMLQNKLQQIDQNRLQRETTSSPADLKTIMQLREQIADLEKRLEKTEEEKFVLEARIEQRHLQGDYDPTKTKIVHFSMNPVAKAEKLRAEELSTLRDENDRLRQRVKLLEEKGTGVEDLTVQVEQEVQASSSKEVQEMRDQLTRADLKNKRLMEAFKKTSQEFREVCYSLTGFKIDILKNNQYRVMSMYAESPDDFLMFQQSLAGEMQLLQTDFSSTLAEQIDTYLKQQDSIPAFLSSVTMTLFSRQTMQVT